MHHAVTTCGLSSQGRKVSVNADGMAIAIYIATATIVVRWCGSRPSDGSLLDSGEQHSAGYEPRGRARWVLPVDPRWRRLG
jgi:hypothetical protein